MLNGDIHLDLKPILRRYSEYAMREITAREADDIQQQLMHKHISEQISEAIVTVLWAVYTDTRQDDDMQFTRANTEFIKWLFQHYDCELSITKKSPRARLLQPKRPKRG